MPEAADRETGLGRRLMWFAGLWLASLAAFVVLAYGGRWLFRMLGTL